MVCFERGMILAVARAGYCRALIGGRVISYRTNSLLLATPATAATAAAAPANYKIVCKAYASAYSITVEPDRDF